MSGVKNIRDRLGGSQQWWAQYLDVSLSLLKMVERGERLLPTPALLKLSAVELLNRTTRYPGTATKKSKAGTSKSLSAQVRKLELQVYRAQQLLERMQQRYAQATTALSATAQLLQKLPATKENKKDKLLLQALQLDSERNLNRFGPEAQALLQWKIDCYTYGMQRAKELTGPKI